MSTPSAVNPKLPHCDCGGPPHDDHCVTSRHSYGPPEDYAETGNSNPNAWLEKDYRNFIKHEPNRWGYDYPGCRWVVYTYRRSGIGVCVLDSFHEGEHVFE